MSSAIGDRRVQPIFSALAIIAEGTSHKAVMSLNFNYKFSILMIEFASSFAANDSERCLWLMWTNDIYRKLQKLAGSQL